MAKTLSNGYIKPVTDDTGDTYFVNLEDNIQTVNDHDHTGGAKGGKLMTPTTQTIASGSWVDQGNDTFSQVIDVTSANSNFTVDAIGMEFRLSNGDVIYPTVNKTSSTTYTIFINDSSQALTALYTH